MITAKEFQELYIDEDQEVTLDSSLQVSFGEWENTYKDNDIKVDVWFVDPQYFSIISSRSGSYYHDYDYGDDEVYEVFPKVITKTVYVTK